MWGSFVFALFLVEGHTLLFWGSFLVPLDDHEVWKLNSSFPAGKHVPQSIELYLAKCCFFLLGSVERALCLWTTLRDLFWRPLGTICGVRDLNEVGWAAYKVFKPPYNSLASASILVDQCFLYVVFGKI